MKFGAEFEAIDFEMDGAVAIITLNLSLIHI